MHIVHETLNKLIKSPFHKNKNKNKKLIKSPINASVHWITFLLKFEIKI